MYVHLCVTGDSEFEWDEAKRQSNLAKHGLDFTDAVNFDWDFAYTVEDIGFFDEVRFISIAPFDDRLAVMIYTYRGDRIRIISLRRPENHETKLWRKPFYDEQKTPGDPR